MSLSAACVRPLLLAIAAVVAVVAATVIFRFMIDSGWLALLRAAAIIAGLASLHDTTSSLCSYASVAVLLRYQGGTANADGACTNVLGSSPSCQISCTWVSDCFGGI